MTRGRAHFQPRTHGGGGRGVSQQPFPSSPDYPASDLEPPGVVKKRPDMRVHMRARVCACARARVRAYAGWQPRLSSSGRLRRSPPWRLRWRPSRRRGPPSRRGWGSRGRTWPGCRGRRWRSDCSSALRGVLPFGAGLGVPGGADWHGLARISSADLRGAAWVCADLRQCAWICADLRGSVRMGEEQRVLARGGTCGRGSAHISASQRGLLQNSTNQYRRSLACIGTDQYKLARISARHRGLVPISKDLH